METAEDEAQKRRAFEKRWRSNADAKAQRTKQEVQAKRTRTLRDKALAVSLLVAWPGFGGLVGIAIAIGEGWHPRRHVMTNSRRRAPTEMPGRFGVDAACV